MAIVNIFRGISGSQYVYWDSTQAEPANVSNKAIVRNLLTPDTVDTASIVAAAVVSSSNVLWNTTYKFWVIFKIASNRQFLC